jgi:hypothetical protein
MACTCTCSPIIKTNQDRYHSLGGETVGCCGDENHTYGFHCPPCRIPNDDYSIVRSGGEGNQNWACAGDFSHNAWWSREWLAWFLEEVRAGVYPQVLEIIGSLDGQKAMIWQEWNGWAAKTYTGGGHVTWCHISADRTRAGETPDFFAGWHSDGSFTGGSGSTLEDDTVFVAQDGSGQHWVCNGQWSRPISEKALGDFMFLADQGYIKLSKSDVRGGWYSDAFGVELDCPEANGSVSLTGGVYDATVTIGDMSATETQ